MQGNKKHTDGQSDSSSVGSLMDETDREVSSLTDRAFKSLCVDDLETSYTETDPVVSPRIQHPFSSKFFQGPRNHAIKKNFVSNKLLPKAEEHSTFQQLSKDTQEEKKSISNVRRKLGLPVPNLRNYKHTSKVSSLIKTFDKVENPEPPAIAKQPVQNHVPKCPLICGANVALWGGKTILNIPRELSEFSGACQNVGDASGKLEMLKRHRPMDLLCQGPPHFYSVWAGTSSIPQSSLFTVSKKTVKKIGKAKDLAGQGNFLHSENSAFESWKAHHKKLAGTRRSTEWTPTEENLAYLEETPCFEESYMPDHNPSPLQTAASVVLEHDFSSDALPQNPLSQISLSPVSFCQSPSLPLSIVRDSPAEPPSSSLATSVHGIPTPPSLPSKAPFPRVLSPQVVASPVPVSKPPIPPPYMPQNPLPSEASSQSTDTQEFLPHVTLLPEKIHSLEHEPELEKFCPPWRRQRTALGGMDVASEALERKDSSQGNPSADTAATESHIASNPSFNITQLLTPRIPPNQEKEPSESQILMITPPLSEDEVAKELEERTFHCSQNNYKSKAPSLLFNLKDIRKRVKSTYSPSPLLKAFEEKKKIKEQDSLKASVTSLLEGSSSKSVGNDEAGQKPSGRMGSTQEKARITNLEEHLKDNYQTLSSSQSKADRVGLQNRNSLQQENSADVEGGEAISVTEHPNKHSPNQPSPSSRSEQDTYMQDISLWDPKNKKGAPSLCDESPNRFFTADENVNDNENPEQKGKRSPSSSEQSFVSIVDQPSHEESFSLMQLFQKACLQESQRNKDKEWEGEKPGDKEEERSGRLQEKSQTRGLSHYDPNTDGKGNGKVEQSEEEDAVQERLQGERREGTGRSPDSPSEGKPDEPLAPTFSSSFKPNLFKIKDNTFKSPPVIKTVKLPLFRSLSCEGAIAGGDTESEKQRHGTFRTTPMVQETDWPLSRNRRQQRIWRVAAATGREADESGFRPSLAGGQRAEKSNPGAESTFQVELGSFSKQQPGEDNEGTAVMPWLVQKEDKDHEKRVNRDKERARGKKLRPSSASQLNLEGDLAQNQAGSPTREKANYYKNNPLSKRSSGSCVKKVITREARSPTISETQVYSPTSSDAFGDTLCTASLASSTVPSPRSDSTMQSTFPSPLSDTIAACSTVKPERAVASSSLHRGTDGHENPSAAETSELLQASQLSGHTDGCPMANERPQLMRQMAKTAAKPPAVPPKTEKTLRRAKKLASRRKKVEAEQKWPPAETISPCEDSTSLPSAQSPLLTTRLNSPVTPSKSNQVALPAVPSSPTPSSLATQRKLLQDPDSGEYFFVDLPIQFKTLYDPESGRYIQVSLPSSKRNLQQTPSSEVLAPPYVLYPSSLPLRVLSVPARASPSQFSEPASLAQGALSESAPDWQQDARYPDPPNSQPYLESAVSQDRTQEAEKPLINFERDVSLSDKGDIISIGAIEDLAVEGIA
ncbi:cardiac-enriched FHL2-interacting protein [Eublepharis macularius]|uniref:Cardiac-enriched FHL2-interacting protein n=1 Tax=Eublepharis macularius TaxID=481883 RepID=A0AA97JJW3_EUBMA|nr:cardiac-enriched FHL2-interacting protein [Eublepharis macularius]XP_054840220.1 cardiac-enriched FHL2-interacting protein [Eublepharis macularius]XP_054840221.1 cardiac-enriched FHL2-interacting protein [Eublepharis macularius]